MKQNFFLKCLAIALALTAAVSANASTLEQIQARGMVICGVVSTPEDWNKSDLHGPLDPLALEFCKAVSVAALGSEAKLEVRRYPSELEAEQGLSTSEVDLVAGVSPETTAMWHLKISFGPPLFFDGQGFLLRNDAPMTKVADLSGIRVCTIEGTDNEKILLARTVAKGIDIVPMPFQEEGEMDDGLAVRHCDAISAYRSHLARVKVEYAKQLGRDHILDESLTLAPFSPAYRQGDPQWSMIVDYTLYALLQAEASGVTQSNVEAQLHSEDPVVQRLLGIDWSTSRALGLKRHDWAAQVIAVVGNYGEMYDRTVGLGSALQLARGQNSLWLEGGLMHPMPVQ